MTIKLSAIKQFDRDNKNLKDDIMISFKKASSLQSYDNFEELASLGAAEKVTNTDTTIAQHELFLGLVGDARQIIEFMDKQLEKLGKDSIKHISHMTSLQSSSGGSMNYPSLARDFLSTIASILNANYDSKYIFGGDNYIQPPVADIVTKSNLVEGIPTSNYYQGGSTLASVIVNDLKTTVEYGINADNDAFQELIAGVHLSLTAFNGNKLIRNSAVLDDAATLVKGATMKIIEIRAKLGNDWKNVDQNFSSRNDEKGYWHNENIKILGIDIIDANRELEDGLRQLESSYHALKKANSVTFPDI